jgi:hypothetical protein
VSSSTAKPISAILAMPVPFFVVTIGALLARLGWSPWVGYRQAGAQGSVPDGGVLAPPSVSRPMA